VAEVSFTTPALLAHLAAASMSCVYALHWRLPALSLLPLEPSGSLGFYLCSWAVPLRGPMWERYTVVLALPPCKSRNATQVSYVVIWTFSAQVCSTYRLGQTAGALQQALAAACARHGNPSPLLRNAVHMPRKTRQHPTSVNAAPQHRGNCFASAITAACIVSTCVVGHRAHAMPTPVQN